MKRLKDEFGQDVCPHCGAPLESRNDYRYHLSLMRCQQERPFDPRRPYPEGFDKPPGDDPGWCDDFEKPKKR